MANISVSIVPPGGTAGDIYNPIAIGFLQGDVIAPGAQINFPPPPPKEYPFLEDLEQGRPVGWGPEEGELPKKLNKFIGRSNLLNDIRNQLNLNIDAQNKKKRSTIENTLILVCYGLGGVGKSRLALEHANATENDYNVRIWLPAEDPIILQKKYLEMAEDFGYEDKNPSFQKALKFMKNWFLKNPGWLLILDNVTNYASIEALIPAKGGRVLITSRYQEWPNTMRTLPVGVMVDSDAACLVQAIARREDAEISELVTLLGGLPLALVQAGAYISHKKITTAKYLEDYKIQEKEMFAYPLPVGEKHEPVAVTWGMSIKAIEEDIKDLRFKKLASNLLLACAYLTPDCIPREILYAWVRLSFPDLNDPQPICDEVVGHIQAYSLLDVNGKLISMHRLVQSVLRSHHASGTLQLVNIDVPQITPESYEKLLVVGHVTVIEKLKTRNSKSRDEDFHNILPNLVLTLEHCQTRWPTYLSSGLSDLSYDIGQIYLNLMKDLKSCRDYYQLVLKVLESHFGSKGRELVGVLIQLGKICFDYNDIQDANMFFERALGILEPYCDGNDPIVSHMLSDIAAEYSRKWYYVRAKEIYEKSVLVQEKCYNHVDLRLVFSYCRIAEVCDRIPDEEKKSQSYFGKALEIADAYEGSDFRQLSSAFINLGLYCMLTKNPRLAAELYEKSLNALKKLYGKDHPTMVMAMRNLSYTYRDIGDTTKQKEIFYRILNVETEQFGDDSENVGYTLSGLAEVFLKEKNIEEAKRLMERALEIEEKHLEPNRMIQTLTLRGFTYRSSNENELARELFDRAQLMLNKYREKMKLLEVIERISLLAAGYKSLQETQIAKEFYEEVLKLQESYYGKDHPESSLVLMHLGNIYCELKDFIRAEETLDRSLRIRKTHYGNHHINVAHSLESKANLFFKMENVDKAIEFYSQALEIEENDKGKNHFSLIKNLAMLGNLFKGKGDIETAATYYKRVMEIVNDYPHPLPSGLNEIYVKVVNIVGEWEGSDNEKEREIVKQLDLIQELAKANIQKAVEFQSLPKSPRSLIEITSSTTPLYDSKNRKVPINASVSLLPIKENLPEEIVIWRFLNNISSSDIEANKLFGLTPYDVDYKVGNCLFDAIRVSDSRFDNEVNQVRMRAISQLQNDPELQERLQVVISQNEDKLRLYDGSLVNFSTPAEYIEHMSNDKTWGTYLEIVALSRELQRPIVIFSQTFNYPHIVELDGYRENDPIFIQRIGEHYRPMAIPVGRSSIEILGEIRSHIQNRRSPESSATQAGQTRTELEEALIEFQANEMERLKIGSRS